MHDTIAFGTVLAAILAGILLNRSDTTELHAKIEALRREMHDKFDGANRKFDGINDKFDALRSEMHGEFERFYRTLGEHEAKIANLEKR